MTTETRSLIRVDDAGYARALTNVIRLTGSSHAEAAWLLQAVYAATRHAPPALMLEQPKEYPGTSEVIVMSGHCPWGYLRSTGELLMCCWADAAAEDRQDGFHRAHPGRHEGAAGALGFGEDEPRSVNVEAWEAEGMGPQDDTEEPK